MQFFQLLYRIRKVIGISWSVVDDGEEYVVCLLAQVGDKVEVRETHHFNRQEDVIAYCKENGTYSVCLNIHGKGVLVKQVDNTLGGDWDENYLYDIFPNFSSDNYYYSFLEGDKLFWLCIAQRQRVDEVIQLFAQNDIAVVQVFLGPFVLSAILRQLNMYEQKYTFDGHSIETTVDGLWKNYDYDQSKNQTSFNIKIADRPIEQRDVQAYATAFNTLLNGYVEDYGLSIPIISNNFEEAKAKVGYKNNGLLILIITFLLLLISTLMFQVYYKKNEQLRQSNVQQQDDVEDREKRLRLISEKEQLLLDIGWNGGVHKAWLLDQLALSMNLHRGISLTALEINPLPEGRRIAGTQLSVDNRYKIILRGQCMTLEGLNTWVSQLSDYNWVKRVQITRFTPSELSGDDFKVFTLDMGYTYAF